MTRESGTIDAYPDVVGTVELTAWPVSLDVLRERLRPWGLATLKTAGLPFGRYCAELVTLDEDGDPDRAFGREPIAWSGESELVPAYDDAE